METSFSHERDDQEICIIRAKGEVDIETAPRLDAAIREAIKTDPKAVLIDLTDVSFLDSSGMRVLVTAQRELEEQGSTLTIDGMSPALTRVFEIAGVLDQLAHPDAK